MKGLEPRHVRELVKATRKCDRMVPLRNCDVLAPNLVQDGRILRTQLAATKQNQVIKLSFMYLVNNNYTYKAQISIKCSSALNTDYIKYISNN